MSAVLEQSKTFPTGTWQVDPVHSQVGFEVEYMVGTFRGAFSPVEAMLVVGDAGHATLKGAARAENIMVQGESLSAHLLSPEFFDAGRTPVIGFASSDVRRSGDEVEANGELTIKGVTQPVRLRGTLVDPIEDAMGRERIGLELSTTVDRTSFGLDWNLPLPDGRPALANDVRLTAQLYLVKA
jgi:polyisoprenoid-binding protein YceI